MPQSGSGTSSRTTSVPTSFRPSRFRRADTPSTAGCRRDRPGSTSATVTRSPGGAPGRVAAIGRRRATPRRHRRNRQHRDAAAVPSSGADFRSAGSVETRPARRGYHRSPGRTVSDQPPAGLRSTRPPSATTRSRTGPRAARRSGSPARVRREVGLDDGGGSRSVRGQVGRHLDDRRVPAVPGRRPGQCGRQPARRQRRREHAMRQGSQLGRGRRQPGAAAASGSRPTPSVGDSDQDRPSGPSSSAAAVPRGVRHWPTAAGRPVPALVQVAAGRGRQPLGLHHQSRAGGDQFDGVRSGGGRRVLVDQPDHRRPAADDGRTSGRGGPVGRGRRPRGPPSWSRPSSDGHRIQHPDRRVRQRPR